jgi:uncharacterized protein YbjQ (UPF0145 family)
MIIVNTDCIEGKKIIKTLGLVKGNTIRARWVGRDIMAGLKQLVGGELKGYTQMMTDAREQAVKRMMEEAKKLKADAIINVRFTSAQVMQNAAEILVYGTAVKIR